MQFSFVFLAWTLSLAAGVLANPIFLPAGFNGGQPIVAPPRFGVVEAQSREVHDMMRRQLNPNCRYLAIGRRDPQSSDLPICPEPPLPTEHLNLFNNLFGQQQAAATSKRSPLDFSDLCFDNVVRRDGSYGLALKRCGAPQTVTFSNGQLHVGPAVARALMTL
ncbi:hypothetical protein NM688_g3763 [Phlebia brevispora]|uniref:Uncharacterized protein n=1 Tax=Phlebia brevispora TaxID=194682 RepID=A0ACC1T575_9APHY|nr:hypothetical protein NM688_g3763 [Phlebia brevispora]